MSEPVRTPHAASYRFLGSPIRLTADDPDVLSVFDGMYRRFRDPTPDLNAPRYEVFARPNDGPPRVCWDGGCETLMDGPLAPSHAYMIILRGVLRSIGGHYMIHAGTVVKDGGAVLIVGGSGFGKTTLILKLLGRGFALCSDEFACVDRTTSQVHPFPRSIGLREKTLDLFPDLRTEELLRVKNIGRGHKYLFDALTLPGAALAEPAPISHVLLIDAGEAAVPEGTNRIDLALTEPRPDLLDDLGNLDGVERSGATEADGYTVWRLRIDEDAWEQAAKIVDADRRGVLYVERIFGERPDFSKAVSLEPMKKSEAAMILFRNLRNRMGCFGSEENYRARASITYMEMVRLLRPAVCRRMTPGALNQMAEMIEALIAEGKR